MYCPPDDGETPAILQPYPFPEGMEIPRLMPFQEYPWNGDHFIAEEVLRLKEAHGLSHAFETGTCLGSTTIWLAEKFGFVTSTEVHVPYKAIAMARMSTQSPKENWMLLGGDASKLLADLDESIGMDTLCFLDAHWGPNCPLLNELETIASAKVKPCILIHDFQVPGTDFGFDKMPDGRPFNLDLIKGHLDAIYGEGKWEYRYPTEVAGARRGWISISPKT